MSHFQPQSLSLFDSYLKKIIILDPTQTVTPDTLKLYSCGPTVYNYQHIGNMRAVFLPDMITKVAKIAGWDVQWALNITDVGHLVGDGDSGEDKVEKMARQSGNTIEYIVDYYTKNYQEQCKSLHVDLPTGRYNPKASDYIEEQMRLTLLLLRDGYAYLMDDGVYFDYAAFEQYSPQYATLPESIKAMLAAGATEQSQANRAFQDREIANTQKDARDFALWKCIDAEALQKWRFCDYPSLKPLPIPDALQTCWGCPGWHSECVAMICAVLNGSFLPTLAPEHPVIDIHTGGEDHIDIHHKNEILQSAALGFSLSRFWVHNKFVMVDGAKMSKSLGNVYLVTGKRSETGFESIAEMGFDPLSYRLMMLEHSYDSQMNFTWDKLTQSQTRLHGMRKLAGCITGYARTMQLEAVPYHFPAHDDLTTTLATNLNTPLAVEKYTQELRECVTHIGNKTLDQTILDRLTAWDNHCFLLDLFADIPAALWTLATQRTQAKQDKDFARADALRRDIQSQGYEVDDYEFGSGVWKK
jgi:cysteinyl-tRNA synthetase